MSDFGPKTLLPEGLRDLLPPDAALEADVVTRLKQSFAANGYELVKPPLVEFEDTLLAGVGSALGGRIFRMLDPVSHKTLGVRADMTTQVARIASTRLSANPRPLRLMYAGQVLRVRGSELEPERQFTQAGLELIGADAGAADAEVILVIAEALTALGIANLTIDLSLPTLVPAILAAAPAASPDRLRNALAHKDVAEIAASGGAAAEILGALVEASGPLATASARVAKLKLPTAAKAEWQTLMDVAAAVQAAAPGLSLTVDAVESRGFEYHTGVSFSVFAPGAQRELGRGGRYKLSRAGNGHAADEPATGATLLVDALLGVVKAAAPLRRLFVPFGTARAAVSGWQGKGYVTITGLAAVKDAAAEARRLGCTHVLDGTAVTELK